MAVQKIQDLLKKADAFIQDGNTMEGIKLYDAILAQSPKDKEALVGKAKAMIRTNRTGEALGYLEYASGSYDDHVIWNLLGTVALASGKSELAMKAFSNYQRLEGASASTYVNLSIASYLGLDIEKAKQYIELALLEDKGNAEAGYWQQKFESIKNKKEMLIDIGKIHCKEGRYKQGIAVFTEALEIGESSSVHLFLGRAYIATGQLADAILHLDVALKKKPKDLEIMADLATAYYLDSKKKEAELLYDRILELDPDNVEALLGKGRLLVESKEYKGALKYYIEPVIAEVPSHPEAWLLKAQLFERKGDLYEGRVCADHAIALEPHAAAGWAVGATIAKGAGDKGLAALYFAMVNRLSNGASQTKSITLEPLQEIKQETADLHNFVAEHPAYIFAYTDRVSVYEILHIPGRSVFILDALWQKYPNMETHDLMCKRGALLINMGEFQNARASFARALEINPENEAAKQGLSIVSRTEENAIKNHQRMIEAGAALCQERKYEEGLKLFNQALALFDSVLARLYIGRALMALNRHQEAIPHLLTALKMEPNNPDLKADIAKIHERHLKLVEEGKTRYYEGKFQEGLQLFSQALQLGESFPATLYMGKTLAAVNKHDQAMPYLRTALDREPDNKEAMIELAASYMSTDQKRQAEQLYDRILNLDEKNVDALLGKSRLLMEAGKVGTAHDHIDQALMTVPNQPAPWLLKAQLYHKQNNLREARLCADHAIALNVKKAVGWMVGSAILQTSSEKFLASRYLAMAGNLSNPGPRKDGVSAQAGSLKSIATEAAELDAFIVERPVYLHAYSDRAAIYEAIGELDRARYYNDNYIAVLKKSASLKTTAQPVTAAPSPVKTAQTVTTPPPPPLTKTTSSKTQVSPTGPPQPDMKQVKQAGKKCRFCGRDNPIEATSCKSCGKPTKGIVESKPLEPVQHPEGKRELTEKPQQDLESYKRELGMLEVKLKVGEISSKQYHDLVTKLQAKIKKLGK